MINPYLVAALRRSERIFAKQGAPNMAIACQILRGRLADNMNPDETEARRLVSMAEGPLFHA